MVVADQSVTLEGCICFSLDCKVTGRNDTSLDRTPLSKAVSIKNLPNVGFTVVYLLLVNKGRGFETGTLELTGTLHLPLLQCPATLRRSCEPSASRAASAPWR